MPSEPTTEVDVQPIPASGPRRRIEYSAVSDVGSIRRNNEDHYLICRLCKSLQVLDTNLAEETNDQTCERDGYLLLVADGMGGVAAGEHASAAAVRWVKRHLMDTAKWFYSLNDPDEHVRIRMLRESLEGLDRELIEAARRDPSLAGMGTTLTAAGIVDGAAFVAHVGDSRLYLLRDRQLEQLTQDHTVAQKLVDAGVLKPEEVRTHRSRHILTNSLGGSPGVRGEIVNFRLSDGDRLLLCTDGLSDMVHDEEITAILLAQALPGEACRALRDAALREGGHDNITVIVANYAESS
jgi:protein phosphatase